MIVNLDWLNDYKIIIISAQGINMRCKSRWKKENTRKTYKKEVFGK